MQGPAGGPTQASTPLTARTRGAGRPAGGKRGRRPKASLPSNASNAPAHPTSQDPGPSANQPAAVQWAQPITQVPTATPSNSQLVQDQPQETGVVDRTEPESQGSGLSLPGTQPVLPVSSSGSMQPKPQPDEDVDGDDELLPAMADDDFAAQSSWNSQSKDNLK